MFEALSDRLDGIFGRLRGKGRLSEDDIDEVLREIRLALLEADVNFKVVKGFIGRVKDDLVGEEINKALRPDQQVVKAVHDELVNTLGGETLKITYAPKPPTVVLMAGLQGSGKTTTSAKLARWFKKQGRNPLLVGADLQRPAAVEQLRTLGRQVEVPVFSEPSDPVEVSRAAMAEAKRLGRDVVIVDTAGRLAIDAELMEQVRQISEVTQPHYTFLVIDAMTGQDAVTTAEAFHETLELDGVILTKLDGDARGGAALSVKEVVGRPIAFASTGEKLKDFDQFHPERLAGRILGMGDVLTLIEKAEEVYEKEEAEEAAAKLLEGQFTLEDFLDQMQQVKKMGPLSGLVKMLPGVPKELRDQEIDDRELAKVEAMIYSMTLEERRRPELIDTSRRTRIANGSGTQPQDVSQLLTQFKEMQKLMKRMGGFGSKKVKKGRKDKKGKGGGGRAGAGGGGRVTPRGGKVSHGRVTPKGKAPLTLPNLETGGRGDDGLPDLGGLDLEALGIDPDALGLDPKDLPRRR
ncbi:MAG: signal recognition particle protein [Acidimicrobiales bacterium]